MDDTAPAAEEMQLAIQRRLTGEQRLALAVEMSRLARDLLLARLRHEHANWTSEELTRQVLRCAFLSEGLPADLPAPLR
jgi:hypothetical protein